jgi:hypothetical protein
MLPSDQMPALTTALSVGVWEVPLISYLFRHCCEWKDECPVRNSDRNPSNHPKKPYLFGNNSETLAAILVTHIPTSKGLGNIPSLI